MRSLRSFKALSSPGSIAWTAGMKAEQKETMACQQTTEARLECKETTPEDMEAVHREAPMDDAVVKLVGGRKKRHMGRHLAAGRRKEPKELTRGGCGSWGMLAAAVQQWHGARETS
jgi:hypothetical protein